MGKSEIVYQADNYVMTTRTVTKEEFREMYTGQPDPDAMFDIDNQ